MSCETCDGRCCAVFTFPSSPAQIRARGFARHPDAKTLARMLIPLTWEEARERSVKFGLRMADSMQGLPLYKCKHWDEDTRLCTIYDERPKMCADYPYSKPCVHCGWTLPQAQQTRYRTEAG